MSVLEVFSDYACPFCWIGEQSVRALQVKHPTLEIRHRAFELRPEPAPLIGPPREYVEMTWVNSIVPMASKFNLLMRIPKAKVRTRVAHEAAAWARSHGKFDAMHDAIFRSYFEDAGDISQLDLLATLATKIGLNADDLRNSLTTHPYLDEVLTDEKQAHEYGLSGVPAFIWNGHGLVGVQSDKSLERLIEKTA